MAHIIRLQRNRKRVSRNGRYWREFVCERCGKVLRLVPPGINVSKAIVLKAQEIHWENVLGIEKVGMNFKSSNHCRFLILAPAQRRS